MRFHNRSEWLTIDPETGGAQCQWQFTSDLHLCKVYPATGLWLLRRATVAWPIILGKEPVLSEQPRISFVIGHRGEARARHLLHTIAAIAGQRAVPIECIVVEQSVRAQMRSRLPSWVRYVHTAIDSDESPYNRSWALNVGAREARGPLLVLHDNDFLVPAAYSAELVRRHEAGHEVIDLKRFMFYLDSFETERLLRDRLARPDAPPERVIQNLLAGGSIAADRSAYFDIGGFDESFVGWGGEDNDFWERAQTRRVFAYGYLPLIHLWHAPQPEKLAPSPGGGRRRSLEVASTPAADRIPQLRGRLHRLMNQQAGKRD